MERQSRRVSVPVWPFVMSVLCAMSFTVKFPGRGIFLASISGLWRERAGGAYRVVHCNSIVVRSLRDRFEIVVITLRVMPGGEEPWDEARAHGRCQHHAERDDYNPGKTLGPQW